MIARMTVDTPSVRLQLDLERLHDRLNALLSHCDQLEDEVRSLRAEQQDLVHERGRLVAKNNEARTRVEAMLTRLKTIEEGL